MPIQVDLQNPPPWVVHLGINPEVTLPFETFDSAKRTYDAAVASGEYTQTLRTGRSLTFVTLWRREFVTCLPRQQQKATYFLVEPEYRHAQEASA